MQIQSSCTESIADKFKAFANAILPFDITMTQQINIEQY